MASTDIDAALALFESKRREYEAEIQQIDGAIAQLKRWKAMEASASSSKSHELIKRQQEEPTVTEIFLRLLEVHNKPTFRLADMVERIIGSGETHAPRSTIYGNLTNHLKRNSHRYAKVRRGIYRQKSKPKEENAMPVVSPSIEHDETGRLHEEIEPTAIH
jgi:hypothetical protein